MSLTDIFLKLPESSADFQVGYLLRGRPEEHLGVEQQQLVAGRQWGRAHSLDFEESGLREAVACETDYFVVSVNPSHGVDQFVVVLHWVVCVPINSQNCNILKLLKFLFDHVHEFCQDIVRNKHE